MANSFDKVPWVTFEHLCLQETSQQVITGKRAGHVISPSLEIN